MAEVILIVVASVTLATISYGYWFARTWCRPKRVQAKRDPAAYDLPFESVAFERGGPRLRGWFIPAETVPAPAVVLAHAWSANASLMLPLAEVLRRSGVSVLLFDARGHGSSGAAEWVTILSVAEDLRAGVDLLERRGDVDRGAIGVVGHSMGGAAAIVAASLDQRVRAVASIASFADNVQLTESALRHRGLPLWPFLPIVRFFIERALRQSMAWASPVARASGIDVPWLLIQGEADRMVSPSALDRLWAQSRSRAVRVVLPKRDHFDILRDRGATQIVADFLSEALASPRPIAPSARPTSSVQVGPVVATVAVAHEST